MAGSIINNLESVNFGQAMIAKVSLSVIFEDFKSIRIYDSNESATSEDCPVTVKW